MKNEKEIHRRCRRLAVRVQLAGHTVLWPTSYKWGIAVLSLWPAATSPMVWMARKWGLVAGWSPGCSLCWLRTKAEGEKHSMHKRNNASSKTCNSQVLKKNFKEIFQPTVLLSLGSEWKIIHTAKLAAKARPVKTVCRHHSFLVTRTVGSKEPKLRDQPAGRSFPSNSKHGLNVNPPAGEWHFGKWRP